MDNDWAAVKLAWLASQAKLNGGKFCFRYRVGILGVSPEEPVVDMVIKTKPGNIVEVSLITDEQKRLENLFFTQEAADASKDTDTP